ncbi:MAG: class I SAM-dependent methyltransferase [Bryobacterales bacterium]|nr:class I SAM-dependent methyltransferase [Bryobacterales bacterium]
MLSREMFGIDLPLSRFPTLKSVRGLGISDSPVYAGLLDKLFNYENTHLHQEPVLDLLNPDETRYGKFDFVICSEVLEHVTFPLERAFETLSRLLTSSGFLILTTPFSVEDDTIEHFPQIRAFGLAECDGRTVLVGRSQDNEYRVYDRLRFHGGEGVTLEMRIFSESALRKHLHDAGFRRVRIETKSSEEHGVFFSGPCSLPIIAGRSDVPSCRASVHEIVRQFDVCRRRIEMVRSSRWVRLGRLLGVGPQV